MIPSNRSTERRFVHHDSGLFEYLCFVLHELTTHDAMHSMRRRGGSLTLFCKKLHCMSLLGQDVPRYGDFHGFKHTGQHEQNGPRARGGRGAKQRCGIYATPSTAQTRQPRRCATAVANQERECQPTTQKETKKEGWCLQIASLQGIQADKDDDEKDAQFARR